MDKWNLNIFHALLFFALLKNFTTRDRIEHLIAAVAAFLVSIAIILVLNKRKNIFQKIKSKVNINPLHFYLMTFFTIYIGSWFPDIDWIIHWHRSPLTHSFIPVIAIALYLRKKRNLFTSYLNWIFGIGLASHLAWDFFPYARIRHIPGIYGHLYLAISIIVIISFIFFDFRSKLLKEGSSKVSQKLNDRFET
ncbi:hypothetical protein HBN50_14285 [Halobacteriovorax sp. GB3]|nr:hypothetical protein [Halobacteriovorax sp. GB3]